MGYETSILKEIIFAKQRDTQKAKEYALGMQFPRAFLCGKKWYYMLQ